MAQTKKTETASTEPKDADTQKPKGPGSPAQATRLGAFIIVNR